MRYPVELVPEDNGTVTAYVPDIPGCHTFGNDQAEALARAVDAAEAMLAAMMADGEDIPSPREPEGRPTITIPATNVARIGLYRTMRDAKIDRSELAGRLGWSSAEIDRVLDLNQASSFEQVEAALRALGKEIEIQVLDAA